jgi:hypothetical protein
MGARYGHSRLAGLRTSLAILVLSTAALAQSPALNAVSPPTNSTLPNYADFTSYVIPNPTVNGVTIMLPWSQIDVSTTSTQKYDFATFESDNNFSQYENQTPVKVVNFIVMPATEGGVNSYTPSYVFSQGWANSDGTYSWEPSIPGWSPGTKYLPTTYIRVSGRYQQEVNTVTPSSGFDGRCVSGSSSPTFSTTIGGLSTEDGTAPTQCQWQDLGPTAPVQTMANCQNYEGAPMWKATTGFPNGAVIAPDPTQFNFHYYQQISGTNCTTLGTPPTTWNTTGGNTSDYSCTWHDIGTTIPTTPTYQGLPVSYNLPFLSAYQMFAAAVYTHYSTDAPAGLTVGYIRFGMTQGGEASPLCNTAGTQSSGWPDYSKYTYLGYIHEMTDYFSSLGTTTVPQLADMHMAGSTPDPDYADQEALYAFNDSIGLSTNGLDVDDVLNITGDAGYTQLCSTTPKGCTNGDWYYNFKVVPVGSGTGYCGQSMPNGNYPICSLQTLTASTPTSDTVPNTGSLSVNGTFPGLIPTAQANGATNLEIYPIDTLLATDPNYCNDVGASCTPPNDYAVYQADYESAFETFLSQTPGIYSPAFNSTLSSDTSVNFYWYPEPTATEYKILISSGAGGGGTMYYGNNAIPWYTPSVTASMSPTLPHGATVYVHLYYQLGGVWTVFSSGHYTAP